MVDMRYLPINMVTRETEVQNIDGHWCPDHWLPYGGGSGGLEIEVVGILVGVHGLGVEKRWQRDRPGQHSTSCTFRGDETSRSHCHLNIHKVQPKTCTNMCCRKHFTSHTTNVIRSTVCRYGCVGPQWE